MCGFGCYSQRKVKNSESKSQLLRLLPHHFTVVIHSVKLKILKANHNAPAALFWLSSVVIHSVKLKILKANHNILNYVSGREFVVIHSVKLKILKANHNEKYMENPNRKLLFTA